MDADLTLHMGLLAYARALDIWGRSGKVDVAVPYSGLSGTAVFMGQEAEREVTGFHDPRFRLSVNLYGRRRCRSRSSPRTSRTSSSGSAWP